VTRADHLAGYIDAIHHLAYLAHSDHDEVAKPAGFLRGVADLVMSELLGKVAVQTSGCSGDYVDAFLLAAADLLDLAAADAQDRIRPGSTEEEMSRVVRIARAAAELRAWSRS
jgi:hypothetical protein